MVPSSIALVNKAGGSLRGSVFAETLLYQWGLGLERPRPHLVAVEFWRSSWEAVCERLGEMADRGLGRRRAEEVPLSRSPSVRSTPARSETRRVREISGSDGSQVRSCDRKETSFSGFLRQEALLSGEVSAVGVQMQQLRNVVSQQQAVIRGMQQGHLHLRLQ